MDIDFKNIDPSQFKKTKTVGDLKKDLSIYPDDMELYFEGFEYYRVKQRGDNILQIELNEKVLQGDSNWMCYKSHLYFYRTKFLTLLHLTARHTDTAENV